MLISSKGQVTIPATIRRKAGMLPNTEVEFVLDKDRGVVLRVKEGVPSRGERLVEKLRGFKGKFAMSTDELMTLTRSED